MFRLFRGTRKLAGISTDDGASAEVWDQCLLQTMLKYVVIRHFIVPMPFPIIIHVNGKEKKDRRASRGNS
jgi:hypothetical protein